MCDKIVLIPLLEQTNHFSSCVKSFKWSRNVGHDVSNTDHCDVVNVYFVTFW